MNDLPRFPYSIKAVGTHVNFTRVVLLLSHTRYEVYIPGIPQRGGGSSQHQASSVNNPAGASQSARSIGQEIAKMREIMPFKFKYEIGRRLQF